MGSRCRTSHRRAWALDSCRFGEATWCFGLTAPSRTVWGAYETAPGGKVVLHHYNKASVWVRLQDTLSIAGDTLVRRTPLIIGPYEERYTR